MVEGPKPSEISAIEEIKEETMKKFLMILLKKIT